MSTLIRDPGRGVLTPIERCKVCGHAVYRSLDGRGRQAKFNVGEFMTPTRDIHVCAGRAGSSPRSGLSAYTVTPAPTGASLTSAVACDPRDEHDDDDAE